MTETVLPLVSSTPSGSPTWVGGDEGIRDDSDATYVDLDMLEGFRLLPPSTEFLPTPDALRIEIRAQLLSMTGSGPKPSLDFDFVVDGNSTLDTRIQGQSPEFELTSEPTTWTFTFDAPTFAATDGSFAAPDIWARLSGTASDWDTFWSWWVQPVDVPGGSWLGVSLGRTAIGITATVRVFEVSLTYIRGSVTRLWPRDDALGLGTVNRIHPLPRANRIVGNQP